MKSLWVATGVIVGLGVAGLIAANTSEGTNRTINVGDTSVDATSASTTSSVTTTTSPGEESVSTSPSTEVDNSPTATQPFVGGPGATTPAPSTTGMPTTTTSYWRTVGDACSTPGAIGVSGSGVTLICIGSPSSWQPS